MKKWLKWLWYRMTSWRFRRTVLRLRARAWRRMLFRTRFIAVTGSVGKTTAKECLAAILSKRHRTAKTRYNRNGARGVSRTILSIRPRHRFAVVEVATETPGQLAQSARLVRPDVAVVLAVAGTHTYNFKGLDNTAAEKARLLDFLPPKGLAILNAEDPRVRAMAAGRDIEAKMFGRSPGLDLWAEEVSSRWPARLTFRAHTSMEAEWVRTQLVGEHWLNSVLAAMLAARCLGVPLKDAAAAVAGVAPFTARMQPVPLPCGATVLRDEANGAMDTMEAALKVMREATADRRVLVVSDTSDSGERTRLRMKHLGRQALELSELAVFVGESGHYAAKAALAAGADPGRVRQYEMARDAAEYLKSELRAGDLVLLKGRSCDHLERILHAQLGAIGCWKVKCRIRTLCDACKELRPEVGLGELAGRR